MDATGDIAGALFGKTRRSLLSLFFTRPDEQFHLRQVLRMTGTAMGAAQRDLRELTAAGILTRTRRGNQTLYQANPDCPVFEELMSLTIKTVAVADLLREALRPLASEIDLALIFGSFTRGQQQKESDLDLLVISSRLDLPKLVTALKPVQNRLGREVNPMLYRPDELRRKHRQKSPFLSRVLQGPMIFLIGYEDELARLVGQRLASVA